MKIIIADFKKDLQVIVKNCQTTDSILMEIEGDINQKNLQTTAKLKDIADNILKLES